MFYSRPGYAAGCAEQSPMARTKDVEKTLEARAKAGHDGGPKPSSSHQGNLMNKELYDKGLAIRSAVLGKDYVENAIKTADDFNRPLQELVTEYCWGAVWGREGLPLKQRSMLNLAMISILNRPHELKAHIKGALTNGVSKKEICEVFLQVAIYAGVPCAVDSFRIAREVFAQEKV